MARKNNAKVQRPVKTWYVMLDLRSNAELVSVDNYFFLSSWFAAAEEVFSRYDEWRFGLLCLHSELVYDVVWPLNTVTDMGKMRERFALLMENPNRMFCAIRAESAFLDMVSMAARELHDASYVEVWSSLLDDNTREQMENVMPGIIVQKAREHWDVVKSMRARLDMMCWVSFTFAPVDCSANMYASAYRDQDELCLQDTNFFISDMADVNLAPRTFGVDLVRCRAVYSLLDPLNVLSRKVPFHIECRFPLDLVDHLPLHNSPLVCVGKVMSDIGAIMHQNGEVLLVSCPRADYAKKSHKTETDVGSKQYFFMMAGDDEIEERVILLEVMDLASGLTHCPRTKDLSDGDELHRLPWNAFDFCPPKPKRADFDPRRLRVRRKPEEILSDPIESESESEDASDLQPPTAQVYNHLANVPSVLLDLPAIQVVSNPDNVVDDFRSWEDAPVDIAYSEDVLVVQPYLDANASETNPFPELVRAPTEHSSFLTRVSCTIPSNSVDLSNASLLGHSSAEKKEVILEATESMQCDERVTYADVRSQCKKSDVGSGCIEVQVHAPESTLRKQAGDAVDQSALLKQAGDAVDESTLRKQAGDAVDQSMLRKQGSNAVDHSTLRKQASYDGRDVYDDSIRNSSAGVDRSNKSAIDSAVNPMCGIDLSLVHECGDSGNNQVLAAGEREHTAPQVEQGLIEPAEVVPAEDKLISVEAEVRLVSTEEVKLVSAEVEVKLVPPEKEVKLVSPDVEVRLVSPDAEVKLVSPDAEARLVSPDAEVKLALADAEARLVSPDAEVRLDSPEEEVRLVSPDAEVRLVSLGAEVGLISPEEEVRLVSPDAEARLVSPDAEVRLVSPEKEVKLVSHDVEVRLVSPNAEVRLVSPDAEVRLVSPGADGLGLESNQDATARIDQVDLEQLVDQTEEVAQPADPSQGEQAAYHFEVERVAQELGLGKSDHSSPHAPGLDLNTHALHRLLSSLCVAMSKSAEKPKDTLASCMGSSKPEHTCASTAHEIQQSLHDMRLGSACERQTYECPLPTVPCRNTDVSRESPASTGLECKSDIMAGVAQAPREDEQGNHTPVLLDNPMRSDVRHLTPAEPFREAPASTTDVLQVTPELARNASTIDVLHEAPEQPRYSPMGPDVNHTQTPVVAGPKYAQVHIEHATPLVDIVMAHTDVRYMDSPLIAARDVLSITPFVFNDKSPVRSDVRHLVAPLVTGILRDDLARATDPSDHPNPMVAETTPGSDRPTTSLEHPAKTLASNRDSNSGPRRGNGSRPISRVTNPEKYMPVIQPKMPHCHLRNVSESPRIPSALKTTQLAPREDGNVLEQKRPSANDGNASTIPDCIEMSTATPHRANRNAHTNCQQYRRDFRSFETPLAVVGSSLATMRDLRSAETPRPNFNSPTRRYYGRNVLPVETPAACSHDPPTGSIHGNYLAAPVTTPFISDSPMAPQQRQDRLQPSSAVMANTRSSVGPSFPLHPAPQITAAQKYVSPDTAKLATAAAQTVKTLSDGKSSPLVVQRPGGPRQQLNTDRYTGNCLTTGTAPVASPLTAHRTKDTLFLARLQALLKSPGASRTVGTGSKHLSVRRSAQQNAVEESEHKRFKSTQSDTKPAMAAGTVADIFFGPVNIEKRAKLDSDVKTQFHADNKRGQPKLARQKNAPTFLGFSHVGEFPFQKLLAKQAKQASGNPTKQALAKQSLGNPAKQALAKQALAKQAMANQSNPALANQSNLVSAKQSNQVSAKQSNQVSAKQSNPALVELTAGADGRPKTLHARGNAPAQASPSLSSSPINAQIHDKQHSVLLSREHAAFFSKTTEKRPEVNRTLHISSSPEVETLRGADQDLGKVSRGNLRLHRTLLPVGADMLGSRVVGQENVGNATVEQSANAYSSKCRFGTGGDAVMPLGRGEKRLHASLHMSQPTKFQRGNI